MNTSNEREQRDPLGLSGLPLLEPGADGWAEIRQALESPEREPAAPRVATRWRGWAIAASLLLAAGLSLHQLDRAAGPDASPTGTASGSPDLATLPAGAASETGEDTVRDVIAMSQMLETRLRRLRDVAVTMPAQSAVYVAELEDMIAQVDGDLSANPDSVDLWGQRVNLLLDLEAIFQHQFEREYGRMASL